MNFFMFPNKMNFIFRMESVLLTIICILCTVLFIQLLYKLRSSLLWRVNCWFCNSFCWVNFVNRNQWNCPKCEQYNGFTKDGDYNKPICNANDQSVGTPKIFQSSPPKNGLCKMCNINQQLKVTQLANFVPMNDRNFDEEIESYRMQLEKAYKLCNICKKVVQNKLHKEKETLLGVKLKETRVPEKANQKMGIQNLKLKSFINNTSMLIAGLLLLIVSFECYKNAMRHKNLSSTINNLKDIISGMLDRIASIIKMKTYMTFPSLENYFVDVNNILYLDMLPKHFDINGLDNINLFTQKILGGFVCLIQIIGHIWNVNKLRHAIVIDLLWTVFVITSIAQYSVTINPTIISLVKMSSILAVMLVYKTIKMRTIKSTARIPISPNKMRHCSSKVYNSMIVDEDTSLDTDDDVSLTKFGLHNFSESSNDTLSHLNNTLMNGRTFTPKSNDIWTKPKHNSTFCVNSVHTKSPSSISDNVFVKPSFNRYQKIIKSDSDSDLDESISSLCISSPKKAKKKTNSIFSLRKFTATPNFIAPSPFNRTKPLISPSKLGHSTSWVAGGYWGSEGERQIFSVDGSRSSSQSSGFESQTSSMTQRNVFSQPPSREESVCGEPDRTSMLLDRFQNCNVSNYGNFQTHNFSRMSSPVFPQMQYNGHVHIPQPRLAQQNVFAQQQYVQNSMFRAPGGSRLMKLPQLNSFSR